MSNIWRVCRVPVFERFFKTEFTCLAPVLPATLLPTGPAAGAAAVAGVFSLSLSHQQRALHLLLFELTLLTVCQCTEFTLTKEIPGSDHQHLDVSPNCFK